MQIEIEAKFMDVDHDKVRERLKKVGAKLVSPMRVMRRNIYDYPDLRLQKKEFAWVRLRDEGNKITLTYKEVTDARSIHGTKEVELVVSDFDTTAQFFDAIGFTKKSSQENKRESWTLDGVEIELDEWPHVSPFVEVEGKSEEEVLEIAKKLGLEKFPILHGSADSVYEYYFDIDNGYEVTGLPVLNFETPLPKNIEAKRKG